MRVALLVLLVVILPLPVNAQPANTGGLAVTVTRGGQPVTNAAVCVGVANDLNQFFQGTTDAQGRVQAGQVPSEAYVVTARAGQGGAQQSFAAPASPAGIPVLNLTITIPANGGPSCPTTPAGPQRRAVGPINVVITPVTIPTPIQLQLNNQRCFGALGAQCGQAQGDIPLPALCKDGNCFINPGSWNHDECCVRNPQGKACRLPGELLTGHDGNCVTSWDTAVRLSRKGIMWKRAVDFNRNNGTGTVEFALYCAPANSLLPPADGPTKCCSRLTRALTLTEGVAATAAGETLRACQ